MGIPLQSGPTAAIPPAQDRANYVVTGQFTTTGQSPAVQFYGAFNALLYATGGPNGSWTGSIQLERSFDGGTTWIVCGVGGAGAQAIYGTGKDISLIVSEPEEGVLYRWDCTALSAGTVNYRFSTSGLAAMPWGVSIS